MTPSPQAVERALGSHNESAVDGGGGAGPLLVPELDIGSAAVAVEEAYAAAGAAQGREGRRHTPRRGQGGAEGRNETDDADQCEQGREAREQTQARRVASPAARQLTPVVWCRSGFPPELVAAAPACLPPP